MEISTRCRFRLFHFLLLIVFTVLPFIAFPEGSKDMIANGGDRAFFLSSTTSSVNNPFPTKGVVKVYVKAGETLYLGSSAVGIDAGKIEAKTPNGTVYTNPNGQGLIADYSEENNGPSLNNGVDGGYVPFTRTVLPAEEGVWEISFLPPGEDPNDNNNNLDDPNRKAANANWTQIDDTEFIAAFDVSVRNTANTAFIPGRAYMNVFGGNLGDYDGEFRAVFKVLTSDGYQYEVNNNGQAGYQFVFFVNNKGFRDGAGDALYKSINTTSSPNIHDPRSVDDAANITHKIFFNTPSADLPASAPSPSGTTWLLTQPISPSVTNFLFKGKEGTINQGGTFPLGGYINFDINMNGSYVLQIDVDQNGSFNDAIDVRMTGLATTGNNQIYWDGLDGEGNPVDGGFTFNPGDLKISLIGGEVHFPFLDVESNEHGIILKRLNGNGAPDDIVYWDDSDISTGGGKKASNPIKTGINGVSSTTNGHKWGNGDGDDNDFGNEKGLDTWSYVVSTPTIPYQQVFLKQADLEVQSIQSSKTSYCVGENIVYTVKVKNNGPDDVQGAKFALNFPSDFLVSNVSFATSGGAADLSGGNITSMAYTASLDMENQAVMTLTITGSVSSYPSSGTLVSTASIMRPADVNDPDATNSDDSPPTDPQAECDAGTIGCNNIKSSTSVNITRTNISISGNGVIEGSNGGTTDITFQVALSASSNCPITVDYLVTHQAADPAKPVTNALDFSGSLSGTLTIPANQTSAFITIKVAADKVVEANETFTITLSNASGDNVIAIASAEGFITDDDQAIITSTKVDGNEQGPVNGKFTFSFPPGYTADKDVTIKYNLAGTAISNDDFTDVLSGSVLIPAGSSSASVVLDVNDDDVVEGTENVILNITNLISAYSGLNGNTITLNNTASSLNIFDNDQTTLTITPSVTQAEGDAGTTPYVFTVTLNKATGSGFTINFNTANGTATVADADFAANSNTLNFSGVAGETKNITILVNGDTKIEGNENFYVDLSAPSSNFSNRLTVPVTRATGTITNDDAANLSITTINGAEGGQAAEFIFTLDNGLTVDEDIQIFYTLSSGTATAGSDYSGSLTGSVVIPAGSNAANLSLPVIDDSLIEGDESLSLTVNSIVSSYGITVNNSPQTLSITDDDYGVLELSGGSVAEGNSGTNTLTFTLNLTGQTQTAFTIPYTTTNGTALAGEDFTGISTPTNISFSNTPNPSQQINIVIHSDQKIEADEVFEVLLGALSNNFGGHLTLSNTQAQGTIINDDLSAITIIPANGSEDGPSAATFTFKLDNGITADEPIKINYTLGGSAQSGSDFSGYTPPAFVIIPQDENSVTLTLPVIDDDVLENDEQIVISSGAGSVVSSYNLSVANSPQQALITDNDEAHISISGPVQVLEGSAGNTQTLTYTVTLDQATKRSFSVDFATQNGSAQTSDNDYLSNSGSLSFLGEANESHQIQVVVNGDNQIEPDEDFQVLISNISDNFNGKLTITNALASTQITNDDNGDITVSVQNGEEGGAAVAFTFSLPAGISVDEDLLIPYSISGSTGDITGSISGNITITAGQNAATLTLPVVDDTLIEGTESVTLTVSSSLSNSYGIQIGNGSVHTATIGDNDYGTIEILDSSISENDNGSQLLNFTIQLHGDTESGFSIPYSTNDGTALAGEDYVGVTSSSVSFNGSLNEIRTIPITINGDLKIEANEIFQVILGNPSNLFGGNLTVSRNKAMGTINNNDGGQILITPNTAYEEGSVAGTFNFNLPAGYTADVPLQINYTLGGNAANGQDYSGSSISGFVTIPAGENGKTLTLPVTDDDLVEGTEQIILIPSGLTTAYSAITLDNTVKTINIEDNDIAELIINPPTAVTEGADGESKIVTFTVTLSKATKLPFSIPYTFTDGTAKLSDSDYSAVDGSLSFIGAVAGESRTVTATINGDGKIEADEKFFFNLGLPDLDFDGRLTVPVAQAEALILNDDSGNIAITSTNATEGGTNGTFTFSLPGGVVADKDITIFYDFNGSTASSGDYSTFPSGLSVTIPAGQNSTVLNINVVDDEIIEGNETLTLNATSISAYYGISLPAANSVDLTIADNDTGQIVATAPVSVLEGDNGNTTYTFQVKLNKQTARPFTLKFATQDGTAIAGEDYQAQSGILNFSGAKDQLNLINITVSSDKKVEADELFSLLLSDLSETFGGQLTISSPSVSGTIKNDDSAVIKITRVDGSEGGSNGKYIFSFQNGVTSDQPVTLNYLLGGTATSGDYTTLNPTSITIPANSSGTEVVFNIVDDAIVEDTETILLNAVTLQPTYANIALDPDRPTINIFDNDEARLVISGPPQVIEDNSGTKEVIYTVTLQGNTQSGFTVDYQATDQTALLSDNDYSLTPGTLTFSGYNNETQTFSLFINGDAIIEPTEYLNLELSSLSNPFNNKLILDNSPYKVDIINDDGDDISITHENAIEGSADGKFVFSLPAGVTVAGDIVITYTLGGSAIPGTDHSVVPASGTIILPAGQNSVELPVPVLDDDIIELTETVSISATTINSFGIGLANSTDVLQIKDDDTGNISVASATKAEGNSGTSNLVFNLTLDKQTSQSFAVSYQTQDVTALAGEDYESAIANATVTFAGDANETAQISIAVKGDLKIENDEYFNLLLTALNQTFEGRLTLVQNQVKGTITNDDEGEITITKVDGAEGGATPSFKFSFPPGVFADQPTTISFSLNGTASSIAGIDYTASPSANSVTIPAGSSEATVTFNVNDDDVVELTETIGFASLGFNSVYPTVSLNASRPVINITDNDEAVLTLSGLTEQVEGASGTTKITYTVRLDKATTAPFRIEYRTTDGTATTLDNDYQAVSGAFEFLGKANEEFQFDVYIRGDLKLEADEIFNVLLENLSANFDNRLSVTGAPLAVTIKNDDHYQITISKQDGAEGVSDASYTFSLPNGVTADENLFINYTLMGEASPTKDYTYTAGTLQIPKGENSVSLPVTIVDDAIVEDTEDIIIYATMVANNRQVTLANNDVALFITDNDEALLSITDMTIVEGDAGTQTLSFEVKLNKATKSPFTLNFATADGTATAGEDYVALSNGILSFTGDAPQSRLVNITINGDQKIEADETFRLILGTISNTFNGRLKLDPSAHTALGTILNNDHAQITIVPGNGSENGTEGRYRFAFPSNITADRDVTFNFSLSGTAVAPQDYTVANSGSLTIPAGDSYADIIFNIVDDAIVEGEESITLENLVLTNASSEITFNPVFDEVKVQDNDIAQLQIIAPATVVEGQSGVNYAQFQVKLSAEVAESFQIDYHTEDILASTADNDYLPDAGTLVFTGQKDETKYLNIPVVGDQKIEKDETFRLVLSNLTKNFEGKLTYTPSASTTIINDDQAVLSLSGFDGEESADNDRPVVFRISLEPGVTADEDIHIPYFLGGSALSLGIDYMGNPFSNIILPKNSNYIDFSLPVVDDQVIEGTETVTLTLGTIVSAYPVTLQQNNATLNIIDNDVATLVLSPPVASNEGDSGDQLFTFTLTLNKPTALPFTIRYETVDGLAKAGEDYEYQSNIKTFNGNNANEQQTITIKVKGDRKIEADEDFYVALDNPSLNFINRLEVQGTPAKATILNDDSANISLSSSDGNEQGPQPGSFLFKLPNDVTLDKPTLIHYTLTGTALANTDFEGNGLTGSFTLDAGENSKTLSIPVIDDEVVEDTENLTLTVSSVQSDYGVQVTGSPSTLRILDNDQASLTLSGPLSITEGDSGTQNMVFEVVLNKEVAKNFTVDYRTDDGTAFSSDNDYQSNAGTLVFSGHKDEKQQINVTINGDQKIEDDEYFTLKLLNIDGEISHLITMPTTPTRGNILDDDNTFANKIITITKLDGEEGLSNASFTFTLPPGITFDSDTRIIYALTGSATADVDYDAVASQIVLPAGENNVTLHLNIHDDEIVEDTETVILQTATVTNVKYPDITIANPEITLNIRDNDKGQIYISDASVTEGNEGTTWLNFELRSEKPTAMPFMVAYQTGDGTAQKGIDYLEANGSVAFEGKKDEVKNIQIAVNGDIEIEKDEILNLLLTQISNTFGNRLSLAQDRVEGTILNDDQATLGITASNGSEGGSAASFTITYLNGVLADEPLQIMYTLAGSANGNGVDYSGTIAGTLVIQPGQSSATLTLPVIDDNLLEGNESIELRITGLNSPYQGLINLESTTAEATITDNDQAQLTISGPVEIIEGNSGSKTVTFNVNLNRATGRNFNVKYLSNDGTATVADNDYLPVSGVLDFGGNSSETRQINVQVNGDVKIEQDEDFFINLFDLSDDFNGNLNILASPARGIIKDDDNTMANKTITITPVNGSEDGAPVKFTFAFPSGIMSNEATMIPYSLGGTASAADIDGLLSGTVVIPAGSNAITLTLPVINDDIVEGNETVKLMTGNVSNSTFSGITVSNSPQEALILDNDNARISVANVEVTEGHVGQTEAVLNVKLDKATGLPFTVDFTTADLSASVADADYVALLSVLNFAGQANETQQIKVKINGDRKIEADERLNLLLQSISNNFNGRLLFQNSSATITIKNDDEAKIAVTAENGAEQGQVPVKYRFSLPSDVTSDAPITIQYLLSGTATSGGTDYVATPSGSISIPVNQQSIVLELPVIDDEIIEDDESVNLQVSSLGTPYASSLSFDAQAVPATIVDNDQTIIRLSQNLEKAEGNSGTQSFDYMLTLEKATGQSFTIDFATADGTALLQDNDYLMNSGSISFSGAAGESHTISVLANGDVKIEGDEIFYLNISGLSNHFNNRLTLPVSTVSGLIKNDDSAQITISKIDGTEGTQNGVFTFSLPPSVTSDKDITLNFRLTGTAGTSDYSASPSATSITIPAGQNSASLQLLVNDDDILEERETVILNILQVINPYNNVTVALPVPVLEIYDNDQANLTITNPVAVTEGQSGTKTVDFKITLDKTTDKPFTVKYSTLDATATIADNDYQSKTGVLNFAGFAGESQTISVVINSDVSIEPDEDFALILSDLNPVFDGKLVIGASGKATILNDDLAPVANNDIIITQEDTPKTFSVTTNDTHAEGIDANTVSVSIQPVKGQLDLGQNGELTYTPNADEFGEDSFKYTVKDIWGRLSNEATVYITIIPVNDKPVANDDIFYVQKDSSIRANVALNDFDVDGDILSFIRLENVKHGRIDFFDTSDGTFIYTPEANFKGEDSFTYIINDPSGLKDTAKVQLFVQPKVKVFLTPEASIITEGDSVSITAKLSEFIYQDVNIVLNFSGSADSGDYRLSGNYDTILIPAGDTVTVQKFKIEALKDFLKEGDENISVEIIAVDPSAFVEVDHGAEVLIQDFYPEEKEVGPSENADINPDPYLSPNNDGLGNEHFIIYNIERYPDNEVFIYNRWGNEVYTTKGYNNKDNAFNGIANRGVLANSNVPLVDGVYYFVIYTKNAGGERKMNKGYIIIRR